MDLDVFVDEVDGTQMAAKITGRFRLDGTELPFTAIAFGRIGGQNVGVKLAERTESRLDDMGRDADEVVMILQKRLLQGDMTVPEGLDRESFADS